MSIKSKVTDECLAQQHFEDMNAFTLKSIKKNRHAVSRTLLDRLKITESGYREPCTFR